MRTDAHGFGKGEEGRNSATQTIFSDRTRNFAGIEQFLGAALRSVHIGGWTNVLNMLNARY
jgi:hypothetical protein